MFKLELSEDSFSVNEISLQIKLHYSSSCLSCSISPSLPFLDKSLGSIGSHGFIESLGGDPLVFKPSSNSLPRLKPSSFVLLVRGLQGLVTGAFLDLPNSLSMLLFIECSLLDSDLNHFLSLNKLRLSPFRHGITNIGFPEHSADLCNTSVLFCLVFFV